MSALEVKVPPIGDFEDVPVIEVLVKPGDAVAAGDGLVTLESEKATLDVPSPAAGSLPSSASAFSAAIATWWRSTSKKRRSFSRVSERPNPSVPSTTYRRGT